MDSVESLGCLDSKVFYLKMASKLYQLLEFFMSHNFGLFSSHRFSYHMQAVCFAVLDISNSPQFHAIGLMNEQVEKNVW